MSPVATVNQSDFVATALPHALIAELRQIALKGDDIWGFLEERLMASPALCAARLGATLHMPALDVGTMHGLTPDFSIVDYPESVRRNCLVVQGDVPVVVLTNPFDLTLQTWLETRLPKAPRWQLVHPADLRAYFSVHENELRAMDGALANISQADEAAREDEDVFSLAVIAQDASPVIRLVNSTLFDAMKIGASDIHLETAGNGLHVKYRIDGVLTAVGQVASLEMAEQAVSRVKVMAELDIAERRVPQDGRFKLLIKGRDVDFRVSVMPSLFGEDVVIRILDKRSLTDQALGLRLDLLGFEPKIMAGIRRLAREPYGMFLVTGPTGSGKTTTLYAALTEINNGQDKLVTIEDPIEYQLPGILQIPVNEKKGLSFARGLRSILRHDPDKILVGEIRDSDTAQIAIQSALTGHLVFTSVHANNVFDVLGRFLHMGVDTYSFVSALNGVLAQRLVRINCTECSQPYMPAAQELEDAGLTRDHIANVTFRKGKGCGHCRGTGYKGRKAIAELMRMNDELRELIIARAPIRSIKEAARMHGTYFLRDSAIAAALSGQTTLEEVGRVTFSE
jgi:general secretion pathway protein E